MFSEILKKARKNKGFTQEELANLADISQSSYSDLERGKTQPMRKTKIALARVLQNNLGEPELDEVLIGNESAPSKKEIIEETPIEEIFSLKFGGGTTRRSKEELIKLRKLVERKTQEMLNE